MEGHRLDRIEDKIDKLGERLNSIDVTLAAQHVSLEHHIRRTEILEEVVKPIHPIIAIVKYLPAIGRFLVKAGVLAAGLGIFDQIIKRFM